ncbi:MAG: restriction endonuclease subunit S [Verrucomicrobiota bacterium]|nr:restriction endonuclease subunit S [Verrucomicrobiota bacterium]
MNRARLGDICEVNPSPNYDLTGDENCTFIPMDAVDDTFGTIVRRKIRRICEVETGYTFFREDDVLFAKITPCMENGKCAIAKKLTNKIGFGSTEFHVIRPNVDIISSWIFFFIRQERVRQRAQHRMTGSAGQKRVPAAFINELEIPLPDPGEQKRIARRLWKRQTGYAARAATPANSATPSSGLSSSKCSRARHPETGPRKLSKI